MLACLFESCFFFFTFSPLLHPEAIFLPWCTHSSLLSLLSIQPRRYRSLVSLSCTSNHSYVLISYLPPFPSWLLVLSFFQC